MLQHFACWVKTSADNILKYIIFLENRIWHVMHNLHEVSDPIFYEN